MNDLDALDTDTQRDLNRIADFRTTPFCYLCYIDCPGGRCPKCFSDDLMRHLKGVGVEYGYEWVIKHLIKTELEEITEEEQDELVSDSVDESYGSETKIGWMTVNTSTIMKEYDPISWRIGINEYFDDSDQYIEIDGALYYIHKLEEWIEEQLLDIPDPEDEDND